MELRIKTDVQVVSLLAVTHALRRSRQSSLAWSVTYCRTADQVFNQTLLQLQFCHCYCSFILLKIIQIERS